MLNRFTCYRKGFLRLHISGQGPERFLNLCCANRMDPWDVCERGEGIECRMLLSHFWKIRPLARKAGVRVRVLGRYGAPFFIRRNRKREGLLLGTGACFALIYALSLFIWNISFEGNYHYSRDTLMEYLESLDVRYGMRKNDVSCEDLEDSLRSAFPEITWVSASVTGTRLVVRIKENEALSAVPPRDDSPCELAAGTAGVITRMIVRQGKADVAVGDTVEEGQLLVSSALSVIDDNGETVRIKYVHADADIYARTQYAYRTEEPLLCRVETRTGRRRFRAALTAGRFRASLSLPARGELWTALKETAVSFGRWAMSQAGLDPGPEAENTERPVWKETTQVRQLCLFGDFYLPVYWEQTVGEETVYYERPYTEKELKDRSEYINEKYIEKLLQKGVHIIKNDVRILNNGLSYTIECTVTAEEEISVRRPVSTQDTPDEEMKEST